jgi:hypothetical protein
MSASGIKVGKEGNKMPGVKRLHQESADVSKAEWIRGHYFGALGLLLGAGAALESRADSGPTPRWHSRARNCPTHPGG